MTRVVMNTNVLVSGLGGSGPPAAIVDAVTAGELTLLSSPALSRPPPGCPSDWVSDDSAGVATFKD